MIKQAPRSFALASIAAWALIWLAMHLWYSSDFELREQRIEALKDQIERQKAITEEYKTRLVALSPEFAPDPRRLSEAQQGVLAATLREKKDNNEIIIASIDSPEAYRYATVIRGVFLDAGWTVGLRLTDYKVEGIAIHISSDDEDVADILTSAFRKAKVPARILLTNGIPPGRTARAIVFVGSNDQPAGPAQ